MNELSHTDSKGNIKMVDIGSKKHQLRKAKASGYIRLQEETLKLINENAIKKGNVFTTAEIAGIQAAKRASDMIPLCHPIQITNINIDTIPDKHGVTVSCEVMCIGQTGVEMEALVGVNIALLTIYDMCKAVDKTMNIENVSLKEKTKTNIE
jgi:cyclic pyranopterin monophosphate synthase